MSDSGSNFNVLQHSAQASQSDTFDSVSESSERSSALSYDSSKGRGRPRKRAPTEALTGSQSRSKRPRFWYNDDYRGLFNSTVDEITSNKSSKTDDLLQESQIGVTVWSSEEKGAFFHSLTRRGRHDIRGMATDIGTKSESEVYIYSDMLNKAVVGQQIYQTRKNLLDTSNIEAALEVQGDCCAALDLAAKALSALHQNEEEIAEKKKYKEFALLTPRIARWTERCMVEPERGEEEVSHQIPAARVLNLTNFLTLSKRFFMNSVIAEDNWRSYTGRRARSPCIMYTAFSDFYALMISIAQRLVHSSLFFAMSRLRAVSASGHYMPKSYVRRGDVKAAINVLGMKTDAKVFWARVARRCKLRVYEKIRHRQVFGKRYSYVELEKFLSTSRTSDLDTPEMTKDACTSMPRSGRAIVSSSESPSDDSNLSDSTSVDDGGSSALSNDEELSATPLPFLNNHNHKQEGHDDLQDAYAEALDQQAGRNEEQRLWEMLGEDPTERMELADVKLPKSPFPNRRNNDELLDWRSSVDYAGDWELHETQVFECSIANNEGFKRDVDLAAGLTSSESGSGSLINEVTTESEHGSDSDEVADGDIATKNDGAHTASAQENE